MGRTFRPLILRPWSAWATKHKSLKPFLSVLSAPGQTRKILCLIPSVAVELLAVVAQQLKRKWIGIDITHVAINLIKHRVGDAFGDKVDYEVIGEPVSLPDAEALAKQDPYQFQWWALGLVGARPVETEKGATKGSMAACIFMMRPIRPSRSFCRLRLDIRQWRMSGILEEFSNERMPISVF